MLLCENTTEELVKNRGKIQILQSELQAPKGSETSMQGMISLIQLMTVGIWIKSWVELERKIWNS